MDLPKNFFRQRPHCLLRHARLLLDNNKSLQQAFIDMRNVVTDFGRKHHPYAVLLTDCLSALDEGQGAFEKVLLEWVPVQEATLIGSGILSGKLSDALRRASQIVEGKKTIVSALFGALGYPCFLLGIVVCSGLIKL
ncbi:type II secretion system F family protein [Arsenophonus sp.]|uniref:type II secretion system F family protein n=1 Tax=Arsenophonus sp. TaxID=1872640 RepID=UPI003879D048